MKEKVDVYTCSRCNEMFVVALDKEPGFCALCGSTHFEWSHVTSLLFKDAAEYESILSKVKKYFRWHDFDYDNPESKGVYKVFRCRKCRKTLALEHWQIRQLPIKMRIGCKK